MTNSNVAKLLFSGAAVLSLTGCGLASLPGGYTKAEQQTVNELNTANYTPRSAEDRAAILTQDLFAQAAFWSREYDLNPADLEAAINLASTLRRLGNPGKSIEVAQTTRALYPRDVNLMAELAAAHIANNDPKEAISIVDSALGQRQDIARLWTLKGAALDQFEQFAEARQHYSRALSIDPNNASAIANVGLSYALEGDPKTAEIWLRRAANMPGASASVRQNLSLVLGLQNKYDEAEKWARRDLDAQSAASNMSYIRTLRGASTPSTGSTSTMGTRRTVGAVPTSAPRQMAPQGSQKTSSLTPRTYGGQAPTVKPAASYQPLRTSNPQAAAVPANPLAKYSQYGQQKLPTTRLKMAGDITQYEGGPKTSRDIALAMANKSMANKLPTYGTPKGVAPNGQIRPRQTPYQPQMQQQQMVPPPPPNLLGRISQKNTPKTLIARQQQQQLASRFQNQRQMQAQQQMMRPQQGMQAGQYSNYAQQGDQAPAYRTPAPYPNPAAPNYAQQGYGQQANGQGYAPQGYAPQRGAPQAAPQTGQVARQPARPRRR